MAIIKTDLETGEITRLTNAQIKAAIQEQTGWTTAQYQKEYDKLRNKLRNYEAAIGQKTPGAVNEELYRIVQKQTNNLSLTDRQKAILNYTSATTARFREKAEMGKISTKLENIAVNSLVDGSFKKLLEKSATTAREFENWKSEIVEYRTQKDKEGNYIRVPITRAEKGVTAKEVNAFLSGQAKDLHKRQEREYRANKEYYDNARRRPGSD